MTMSSPAIPVAPTTGVPWDDQELGCPLVDFLERFRNHVKDQLKSTGRFDFKDTDHNSKNYAGIVSNKQITIAAVALDPSCKGQSFEEKKRVVLRACF